MSIQLIVTFFSVLIIIRLVRTIGTGRIGRTAGLVWIAAWISIAVIFWSPEIASRLASVFGIGRGADLIVYTAIIVIMYLLYRIYLRLERLNSDITTLTRSIALDEHSDEKKESSDSHR